MKANRSAAVLLLCCASSSIAAQDAEYLSGEQITRKFVSHTAQWIHYVPMNGATLNVYLSPKGSMIATNDQGDLLNTNYWINPRNRQICFGAGACMFVRDDGNDDYALVSAFPGDHSRVIAEVIDPAVGDVNSLYHKLRQQTASMTSKQIVKAGFTMFMLWVAAKALKETYSGPAPTSDECFQNGLDQCRINDNLIRNADRVNAQQRSRQGLD